MCGRKHLSKQAITFSEVSDILEARNNLRFLIVSLIVPEISEKFLCHHTKRNSGILRDEFLEQCTILSDFTKEFLIRDECIFFVIFGLY